MGSTEPLIRVIELSLVGGGGLADLVPWCLFKNKLLLLEWTLVLQIVDVGSTEGLKTSDLNGDTSGLGLFPLCEKALLSSRQSRLPPAAASRAHASACVSLQRRRSETHRVRPGERSPGLMSQPAHL